MRQSDPNKLLKKHRQLIHSTHQKVVSHTQRDEGSWVLHTLMIEGVDAPFQFKRPVQLKSLIGNRVNLTYYIEFKTVAGLSIQVMNVVRIKVA